MCHMGFLLTLPYRLHCKIACGLAMWSLKVGPIAVSGLILTLVLYGLLLWLSPFALPVALPFVLAFLPIPLAVAAGA